jgi:RNA-binding protein NOB1
MSSFTPELQEEWVTPSELKKSKRRGKKEHVAQPQNVGAWSKPLTATTTEEQTQPQKPENDRVVPVVTEIEQQSSFAFSKNKLIVVDTGAIVHRAVNLERFGSEFVTTEAVLSEIRDSKSKYILATLPFELKLREPTRDSIKFVSDYAKRTGDYANLSSCDLGILALTYEIEVEINGAKNIKPLPEDFAFSGYRKVKLLPYSDLYKTKNDDEESKPIEEEQHIEEPQPETQNNEENQEVIADTPEEEEYDSDDSCDDEWITPDNLLEHKKKQIGPGGIVVNSEMWDDQQPTQIETQIEHDHHEEEHHEHNEEEHHEYNDNDVDEVDEYKTGVTEETEAEGHLNHGKKEIGCITIDFSMQNVLLHMGLNLVSIDGRRIKYLTRYVKRCYGCSTLVPDTSRIFCPNCGIDTLKRVTCIIDSATGEAKFYFNPKKKIKERGSKFPLPLPKGGRNNRDPILCEDQLARYKHGMPKKKEQVLNWRRDNNDQVWQPEYSFENGFQGTAKPLKGRYHLGRNTVFNGYGRKNPNEVVKKTGKKKNNNRL